MHDIICPNCGERFLGYDVAFDMSDYVLPLLYSNINDEEAVRQVKFKYYVDEEVILQSNKHEDPRLIECTNPGGPGFNDSAFSFLVNGKILYEYILSKSGYNRNELNAILDQLTDAVEENDFGSITPLQLSQISTLYHVLFGVSDKLVGEISIDDEFVRSIINLSNPIPIPPVGGNPISSAFTKSSSIPPASSSPFSFASTCFKNL